MSRIDVDLLAGVGAISFAALIQLVPGFDGLEELIAPARTIAAFGVAALGRWYSKARKKQKLEAES